MICQRHAAGFPSTRAVVPFAPGSELVKSYTASATFSSRDVLMAFTDFGCLIHCSTVFTHAGAGPDRTGRWTAATDGAGLVVEALLPQTFTPHQPNPSISKRAAQPFARGLFVQLGWNLAVPH